ncbi:hypothetical protein [Parvularcula sp. LCG005]|uniref:HPr family phosphocarrier protein n=1 Tax=Parvularcula sp. LCG005 TaxID=3078805 RepID=UPI002943DF31|nr:hypothetical protein [Parvularcula sp. LCG005]WOI54274.1 hypothetical protein RUI03_04560 [Parvularcula sp. LCG005]
MAQRAGLKVFSTMASAIALNGCVQIARPPAPVAMDTLTYSEAVSTARQEQLLLNIVRLRYNDPVSFVDLERLTTSDRISYDGRVSSNLNLTGAPAIGSLNGSFGPNLSSSPTMVYSTLRGKSYAEQLLQPLPPASIFLLSQSGWNVEHLMLCCVARMGDLDNARTAAGPTPEKMPDNGRFRHLANLMRRLQEKNALMIQVIDPEEPGQGPRVILKWRRYPTEGELLANYLTENWAARVEPMSGDRYVAEITTRGNRVGDFAVHGRSLMSVMSALSQTVHIPDEHASIVSITEQAENGLGEPCRAPGGWEDVTGGYFAVMVAKNKPSSAAVAVEYRDHWFYIDDTCFTAKATLNLLDHLYALQAGITNGNNTLILLGG